MCKIRQPKSIINDVLIINLAQYINRVWFPQGWIILINLHTFYQRGEFRRRHLNTLQKIRPLLLHKISEIRRRRRYESTSASIRFRLCFMSSFHVIFSVKLNKIISFVKIYFCIFFFNFQNACFGYIFPSNIIWRGI